MIGGYILPSRNLKYEESCRKKNPFKLDEFVFEAGGYMAWFFRTNDEQHPRNNVYFDSVNLLIIDGVAVTQDSKAGYRLFNPSTDFSPAGQGSFENCIEKIVSDVNSIFISVHQNGFRVNFASPRASAGRIWYTQPHDGKGLVLCDDFRQLMEFGHFDIEPRAIYGILKYSVSPDPLTIMKDIFSVPPSHFGTYDSEISTVEVRPYFRFDFPETHNCNLEPAKGLLQNSAQFLKSLNPIMLLSGGTDSTLLAKYLGQKEKTNAFFLSFGKDDPQLDYAKEASRQTGGTLDIIYMENKDVLPSMENIPTSYMHPFSDYSTIPTYYLTNHIKQVYPGGGILIDGTGADACFGFGTLLSGHIFKLAHGQPKLVKAMCKLIYNNLELYQWNSKMANLIRLIASSDKDIQLGPLTFCKIESFFSQETRGYAGDVDSAFLSLFKACTENNPKNDSFSARATVGDILASCRAMALKDFHIGQEPLIEIIYPFLWKDILLEQGKLSWNCKVNNGVVKWPLKKLLEEEMPHDFVYRKKSGFTPPFSAWLHQKDVYGLLRDTLLNPEAFISDVISRKKVRRLIDDLPKYKSINDSILFFLWGALFTELWLQANYKPSTFIH